MQALSQAASAGLHVAATLAAPEASSSQRCSTALTKSSLSSPSTAVAGGFSRNAVAEKLPAARRRSGHRAVVCMAKDSAAAGYASALLELANSANALEKIHSDIEAFSNLLNNKELTEFLANPTIGEIQKKGIVKTLAQDGNFHEYTVNFLNLLVDKKRINLGKDIADDFEALYCEMTETQVAIVTSAVKLENSQQALIAKKLQSMTGAKNIKLKNIVDPGLIAGFIVKYGKDGSSLIDMSVKGQLDRLAAQFEFTDAQVA